MAESIRALDILVQHDRGGGFVMEHQNKSTLQFLGGAETVTGSKHLLRHRGKAVLLDCGLFQGLKGLRLRNWDDPGFDCRDLDAVVVSHAHLDHSGYLPLLVRNGFRGKIHCTPGTRDLIEIVLRDSAHLQEEDASRANRYRYSKHKPALPLYTIVDAEKTLECVETHAYGEDFEIIGGGAPDAVRGVFRRAGHILGSATIELQFLRDAQTADPFRVVFSGDLGRWDRPILRDPELVSETDVLLVESTYGDRLHSSAAQAEEELARVITETAHRGGAVIVPAFAIGRTQELIWTIRKLEEAGRLPLISVYVDSPMAINVTELYCRHPEDHDLDMATLMDAGKCPLCSKQYHLLRTPQESKALNGRRGPMVIIAGSGMATGGRVLHHLKERLPDHRTTVLLSGFQADGTRGRKLQDGAQEIRIHGEMIPVRARIETIDGLSAHADQNEIIRWMRGFRKPPACTYLVHGERRASEPLRDRIREELGWKTEIAADHQLVTL